MLFNFPLFFRSWYHAFAHPRHPAGRLTPKRLFILLGMLPLYPLWMLALRFGYLLDALFFPQARRQEVREPVFIIGNFRSGTTFLHRLLAADPAVTGTALWELYFAPSVSYRRLFTWLGRLDARLGGRLKRLLTQADASLGDNFQMHKTSMLEIEEDDLFGYHIWSTYLLLTFFPFAALLRDYLYYDQALPPGRRRRDMTYYRRAIQRHVFAHGGKRYLSKSPSNTPKIRSLLETFPDARFIHLVRDPRQVVPSAISLFNENLHLFADPREPYVLQDLALEQAEAWYRYAKETLDALPRQQWLTICYEDLVRDPRGTVENIYAHFGWDLSPEYADILAAAHEKAKTYRPRYAYSLEAVGLTEAEIATRLGPFWRAYGCAEGEAA